MGSHDAPTNGTAPAGGAGDHHPRSIGLQEQLLASAATDSRSADPTVQLQLPAPMNCLFAVRCHPQYDAVREECDRWALSLFDPTSRAAVRDAYVSGLYPLFSATLYPSTVSKERLVLLMKFMSWLFVLDDTIDVSDEQTAAGLVNALVAVLTSTSSCSAASSSVQYAISDGRIQKFTERLRLEVWEEMCQCMSPSLQRRLVASVVSSLEAMKQMWSLRSQAKLAATVGPPNDISLEGLLELRVLDAFAWPLLDFMEYALGIELPDVVGKTPLGRLVREMQEASTKHIVLANDLLSCGKEFALKDEQSLVGFLMLQRTGNASIRSLSLVEDRIDAVQEALKAVWQMIQEQERACADLLNQIRNHEDVPSRAQCLIYAEELCSVMSGNLYWSTRTGRYLGRHPIPWNTFPSYLVVTSLPIKPLNVLT